MDKTSSATRRKGASREKKQKKKREGLIRAACDVCRKRKLSCDGNRPKCGRCVEQGSTECNYDTVNSDETRNMALKREIDSLKSTLATIASSLTSLKELPPEASMKLLSDVSVSTNPIMELIDTGRRIQTQKMMLDSRISALDTARALFPSTKSSLEFELNILHPMAYPTFAAMMRPDRLRVWADIPTHAIGSVLPSMLPVTLPDHSDGPLRWLNIEFWTAIPISNEMAAKAISVYLRTDHALLGHFDSELFLADFLACRPRFCSPLLVNSLLFYCCVKLTAFEQEALRWAEAFRLESIALLEKEQEPTSLSLSALAFIFAGCIHTGRIVEATAFLNRAVDAGEKLRIWGPADNLDRQLWTPDERRMLAFAAWGTFVHTVFWAFRWWDRLPPNPPNLPIPVETDETDLRPSRYFGSSVRDSVRSNQTFAALCSVLLVIRDAVVEFHRILVDPSRRFSLIFAQGIYRRLLECNDNDTMLLEPNIDAPDYVTIIRMWFHMAVMDLFQPFLQRDDDLMGFSASHSTARKLYLVSLRQLQHLVLLYRFRCPLAMTTPLWHGCIFFVGKAVTLINVSQDSETTFRLCVLMYADLVVAFPGLLDVFRSMMLLGMKAGFVTADESVSLVDMIQHKRRARYASGVVDLGSLSNLDLNDVWAEAAHPEVNVLRIGD